MAGLYFHIPFCKQACTYCDFHFSTSLNSRERVVKAMRVELAQRINETHGDPIASFYFGGGTPSLLSVEEIAAFIRDARSLATVETEAEITIEANPDDINEAMLDGWKRAGITRVSLGTQSFRDDRLKWMGRAHDAPQALKSIALIANAGFTSWTIDLIYGLPQMTIAEWDEQLTIALDHGMPHLSAYCLTIEERTALHHQVVNGTIKPANDEEQAAQFDRLMERMETAGLTHYEISNFGKPGHFALHNSNYWKGVPYLGIGPSAHSFDGATRRWNVSNNSRYAEAIDKKERCWEEEILSPIQRVNERILTGLRTMWGVDLSTLGMDLFEKESTTINGYLERGDLLLRNGHLVLSKQGRLFADRIASDLFITDAR